MKSGYIYVSYDINSSSSGVAALPGHAAIVSFQKGKTVESYPKSRSSIKKEGVQHYSDRWSKRSKVYILTVKGVSDTKYSKAAKYAMSQSGKSYNWVFANKFRVDKYYCSQLVWRAWNKQGKEIDYVTKDTIVTPIELVKSKNTTIIYHKK